MPIAFVILFQGRSGSTFLTEALASHPNISVGGEALAELRSSGVEAQLAWARDCFARASPAGCLALGYKTKLVDVLDYDSFAEVLKFANCRIVHLGRANLVKQAISWIRADLLFDRTATWNIHDRSRIVPPISVAVDEVLDRMSMLEDGKRELEQFVASLGLPTCKVHYEQLQAAPEAEFDRIQQFLGLIKHPLQAMCIKHTDDDLGRVVLNYEELREALAGTVYEAMAG